MTSSSVAQTRRWLPAARWWPGVIAVLVGLLVFTLDQWTKQLALTHLAGVGPVPVLGDWLRWYLVFNPGAAFSLGTSITPVLAAFQGLVALGVFALCWRVRSRWWAVALGLVLGGAAGNLHDRLLRPPSFGFGHVVDFVAVGSFPVFNVADAAITSAAVMIALAALLGWEAFASPVRDTPRSDMNVARDSGTSEPKAKEQPSGELPDGEQAAADRPGVAPGQNGPAHPGEPPASQQGRSTHG